MVVITFYGQKHFHEKLVSVTRSGCNQKFIDLYPCPVPICLLLNENTFFFIQFKKLR